MAECRHRYRILIYAPAYRTILYFFENVVEFSAYRVEYLCKDAVDIQTTTIN